MLVIISKDSPQTVSEYLGAVLRRYPNLECLILPTPEAAQQLLVNRAELGEKTTVFALGPQQLQVFQAGGVLPKNRKVTGLRKQVFQWQVSGDGTHPKVDVMVSYNVGIKEVDYGQFVDLQNDMALACRLAYTGSIEPTLGQYRYVESFVEMLADIKNRLQTGEDVDLALDTETLGLDRFDPKGYLVSIQLCHRPGFADVMAFKSKEHAVEVLKSLEIQAQLGFLLNHPKIRLVAANGKYDLEWIFEQLGIPCTNFRFDTTMVGSLLDENRSNGLDNHAKVYAPDLGGYSDQFDLKADKSRMDLEYAKDPEAFLQYSGGDPDATLRTKQAQREELLQDPELARFYIKVMHPSLRAFEKVERGGVVVDMEAYKELEADLITEMLAQIKNAKEVMGGLLCAKHYDPDKQGGLNLTKASLIGDYMFSPQGLNLKPKMLTEKTKEASSAMKHLEMFEDVPEAAAFVKALKAYSSASKTLSTYVHGFQKHIRSDGRMHPTYYLFAGNKDEDEGGTNTGRLSAKDPAFQTIPKHTAWGKRIRRVFKAPDGYLVLECDYSQGELRVVACVAHEQEMIRSYKAGLDLHVVTGGAVSGFTYEEMMALKASDADKFDEIRQMAKAGNFGLLYGMGVDGFLDYARLNYGVSMERQKAEEFRAGFFLKYPGLVAYHEAYKAFARKHGYVRSPLGRLRHLPMVYSKFKDIASKAERQAINSPVQGTLSDMMIWAIAMQDKFGWLEETPCFGSIHDAGYYYVPEDNAEFYAKRTVEAMQNLPFNEVGWNPQLEFIADAKLGKNMADLKAVKFSQPSQEAASPILLMA